MADKPIVKPRDWIRFGNKLIGKEAVVCYVDENGDVEAVYLDGGKAINSDFKWINDEWVPGQSGGYVDKYDSLAEYVRILRAGRKA
jgi:hypothetical protein